MFGIIYLEFLDDGFLLRWEVAKAVAGWPFDSTPS